MSNIDEVLRNLDFTPESRTFDLDPVRNQLLEGFFDHLQSVVDNSPDDTDAARIRRASELHARVAETFNTELNCKPMCIEGAAHVIFPDTKNVYFTENKDRIVGRATGLAVAPYMEVQSLDEMLEHGENTPWTPYGLDLIMDNVRILDRYGRLIHEFEPETIANFPLCLGNTRVFREM